MVSENIIETRKEELLKSKAVAFSSQKFKVVEMTLESEQDYFDLVDVLEDNIKEGLKSKKIKYDSIKPYCSLSNSQGDGVMFEGVFTYKGLRLKAVHKGFYYHEKSKEFELLEYKNRPVYDYSEKMQNKINKLENDFDDIYISICKDAEKMGYSVIEQADKDATFKKALKEFCILNDLPEMDLFDYDFEDKKTEGYILVGTGLYYNLYIKDFEMIKENKRVIEAKSYLETEYKVN